VLLKRPWQLGISQILGRILPVVITYWIKSLIARRCSASEPSFGTRRKVSPDIGYASLAVAGGSTIGVRASFASASLKASIAALLEHLLLCRCPSLKVCVARLSLSLAYAA
jgi:hypothetical protein